MGVGGDKFDTCPLVSTFPVGRDPAEVLVIMRVWVPILGESFRRHFKLTIESKRILKPLSIVTAMLGRCACAWPDFTVHPSTDIIFAGGSVKCFGGVSKPHYRIGNYHLIEIVLGEIDQPGLMAGYLL